MAELSIRGLVDAKEKLAGMEDAIAGVRSGIAGFARDADSAAEDIADSFGDMEKAVADFFKTGLARQDLFTQGIEFAQSQLTEHLGNEWIERLAGLTWYIEESENLMKAFAYKYRQIENGITAFVQSSAEDRVHAMSGMSDTMSGLLDKAAQQNRAAAIMQRAVALAQAGINTAQAITRTLASAPFPANIGLAAGAGAAGAVQIRKIASTPIPGAETGGRFTVPSSGGVDGALMRVNQGEEVNVTPRGMSGGEEVSQYVFKINEEVIFDIVNRGGKSGDIYVFEPTGNL